MNDFFIDNIFLPQACYIILNLWWATEKKESFLRLYIENKIDSANVKYFITGLFFPSKGNFKWLPFKVPPAVLRAGEWTIAAYHPSAADIFVVFGKWRKDNHSVIVAFGSFKPLHHHHHHHHRAHPEHFLSFLIACKKIQAKMTRLWRRHHLSHCFYGFGNMTPPTPHPPRPPARPHTLNKN